MNSREDIGLKCFLSDKKNIEKGTVLYSISELTGKQASALMYSIGASILILLSSTKNIFLLLLLPIIWGIFIWYKKQKEKKIDKYFELIKNSQKFKQLCLEYTHNELKRKELEGTLEKELKENPFLKEILKDVGIKDLKVESATDSQVQDAKNAHKEAYRIVLTYFKKRDLLVIENGEWVCPFCNSKQKEDYRECLKCHWVVEDFF